MIRRISCCLLLGLLLLTTAVSAQDNSTPTPQTYTVVQGDTLSSIALRFHTTTVALMRANSLANPNRLSIGMVLMIPNGTETVPSTPAQTTPIPTVESPAETPEATAIATSAAPSIGFEIGGEVFDLSHLNPVRQA